MKEKRKIFSYTFIENIKTMEHEADGDTMVNGTLDTILKDCLKDWKN